MPAGRTGTTQEEEEEEELELRPGRDCDDAAGYGTLGAAGYGTLGAAGYGTLGCLVKLGTPGTVTRDHSLGTSWGCG